MLHTQKTEKDPGSCDRDAKCHHRGKSFRRAGLANSGGLVDLLLLVNTELARTAVNEQQKATNDGQDLEEVVLGEVLVGVVLVELCLQSAYTYPYIYI